MRYKRCIPGDSMSAVVLRPISRKTHKRSVHFWRAFVHMRHNHKLGIVKQIIDRKSNSMQKTEPTANQYQHNFYPDKRGRFGDFGGKFVPESLMAALDELEIAYEKS